MLTGLQEYHRPTDLDAALTLLRRADIPTAPLAGGTSLIAEGARGIAAVVDLQGLGLSYIRAVPGALAIGAMTTLQEMLDSPLAQTFTQGLLAQAARLAANRNIRNQATVGGTLVTADARDDLLIALLALDARAVLDGIEAIPAAQITREQLEGRLITEVRIPSLDENAGVGMERVARAPSDRAIIVAAARVTGAGAPRACRVAIGGLTAAAAMWQVTASSPAEALAHLALDQAPVAPDDPLGSADYRREMARVLAGRAIAQAWGR